MGDKSVILIEVKADILALAHVVHLEREFILQQLTEEMWWLRMTRDLKVFVSTLHREMRIITDDHRLGTVIGIVPQITKGQ